MDWKLFVAILAIIVSIISFTLSYQLSKQSSITSMKPVLVFEYTAEEGWIIRNVGNGPALNVVLAMKENKSDWFNPIRIPPLSKDGEFILSWIRHTNIRTLGAAYEDFMQKSYSTTCTDDLSKITEGNVLREWPENEIKRHWQIAAE